MHNDYNTKMADGDSVTTPPSPTAKKAPGSSPGFQKCYLCRQLYGTRSLPIHEKQCLKKWEQTQEDEQKAKKKSKKAADQRLKQQKIKIMTFGRSKEEDDEDERKNENRNGNSVRRDSVDNNINITSSNTHKTGETNGDDNSIEDYLDLLYDTESSTIQKPTISITDDKGLSMTQKPMVAIPPPSQLFGVSSPLGNSKTSSSEHPGSSEDGEKTETLVKVNTGKPRFVMCVYCSKQFGSHSIGIHEKSCREKERLEDKTRERLAWTTNGGSNNKNNAGKIYSSNRNGVIGNNSRNVKSPTSGSAKKLSKSVGDVSLMNTFEVDRNDSGGAVNDYELVKCEECTRKFLKSDIEKHRVHCRVSVL